MSYGQTPSPTLRSSFTASDRQTYSVGLQPTGGTPSHSFPYTYYSRTPAHFLWCTYLLQLKRRSVLPKKIQGTSRRALRIGDRWVSPRNPRCRLEPIRSPTPPVSFSEVPSGVPKLLPKSRNEELIDTNVM